jgi:hypothetical protein
MRKNRFNGFEVLTLSACAFVLGASLMVLGEQHCSKKRGV